MKKVRLFNLPKSKAHSEKERYHKFNMSWLIVETVILAFVIVLFNILAFDIGLFGFVSSAADPESFLPLRAPTYNEILPWLNLWWGLALLLNLLNIRLARWYPLSRLADVGLGLMGIGVLITILMAGPLFIMDPEWAIQQQTVGVNLEVIERTLLPIINSSLLVVSIVALLSQIGASLRKLLLLVRSWRLQEQDIDILFQLSLILAGFFVIFAPLAAVRTGVAFLDFSLPLGLIAALIIVKSINPQRA